MIVSHTNGSWRQTVKRVLARTWVSSGSATHWLCNLGHVSLLLRVSISWVLKGKYKYTRWPIKSISVVAFCGFIEWDCHLSRDPEEKGEFSRLTLVTELSWQDRIRRDIVTSGISVCLGCLILSLPSHPKICTQAPKGNAQWTLISPPWLSHFTLPGWTAPGEGHTCPVL